MCRYFHCAFHEASYILSQFANKILFLGKVEISHTGFKPSTALRIGRGKLYWVLEVESGLTTYKSSISVIWTLFPDLTITFLAF